jgi:hypothetical protein
MFYRVIQSKNEAVSHYDFDNLEDARRWVDLEKSFDENSANPIGYLYSIYEIHD